jgi:hypothetical protein
MSTAHAHLQAILAVFSDALSRLGRPARADKLERWALLVRRAMAGSARLFHTSDHVLTLARDAGPIESLAVLFHDLVYLQVDQGLPADLAAHVTPYAAIEPSGLTLSQVSSTAPPWVSTVHGVFGVRPLDRVSAFAGANELSSALVAAGELSEVLTEPQLVMVLACIEATIPFRGEDATGRDPMERLYERLVSLSLSLEVPLLARPTSSSPCNRPSRSRTRTSKALRSPMSVGS